MVKRRFAAHWDQRLSYIGARISFYISVWHTMRLVSYKPCHRRLPQHLQRGYPAKTSYRAFLLTERCLRLISAQRSYSFLDNMGDAGSHLFFALRYSGALHRMPHLQESKAQNIFLLQNHTQSRSLMPFHIRILKSFR